MNRIDRIFQDLRDTGRGALMPFITAGDPGLESTASILHAAQDSGAQVCEIGVPFSDPVADGPVIQGSMAWALHQSVTPHAILDMVADIRNGPGGGLEIGLILMVSYSIVFRIGIDKFMADAASAGVDGLIIPDLPFDESDAACKSARRHGLILSQLIAPTTPIDRAQRIAQVCTGFVYSLSRSGVTGEQAQLPAELSGRVAALKGVTRLPIAVGFGISSAAQVREVVQVADAAIVGSALMRVVAENRDASSAELARRVGQMVAELVTGLDG